MKAERRVVGGIELEMVRFRIPCPHWRVKVVPTGYIFESGVFGGCRPQAKVWETVEDIARRRGNLWFRETMESHLSP